MSQYPFRYECYVMKCLNIIQTVACVNGLNCLFQRKLQLAKYWPEWHRIKLTYLKEIKNQHPVLIWSKLFVFSSKAK